MNKWDEEEPAGPLSEPPPITDDDFPADAKPQRINGEQHHAAEEDDALPESLSDDALLDAWATRYGENWRYVHRWGKWFQWTGKVWEENTTNRAFDLCRQLTRECLMWPEAAKLKDDARRRLNSASKAAGVYTLLRSYHRISVDEAIWDADPWMLATPDGVIDLKAGKLIDASRDQFCTKSTSIAPLKGDCPLWLRIIERAARGDDSMRGYLQRWCGYFLTGDTKEECFLFVHGPGGSGKSTFIRVISEILGSYSRACNMDAFTTRGRNEHSTEIAKLAGARIVIATESESGAKWNESRIKTLTGRDKIAARFMRQDEFEFMPTFKIAVASNHRPGLKTVGEEMRRRVHLVEFPDSIPEEDRERDLPERLRAEYPAILHWMIHGCLEWQQAALGKPERVIEDTEAYLRDQDVLGGWISESIERVNSFSLRVTEAHRSYTAFVRERGEFEPSMTLFSEQMQARGFDKRKSNGIMVFLNSRLKPSP